ncbi:unnamed protein product [Didymodactylos carnosus]|uniref:G-protein coupled receptors family 1 profile domain-containing protein n=1 Tax=Didymodactylos carnosus TaxID=1234261 RepID=A0A8S2P887_9BILA|nr:unnamed protein product [Didymodactylos carnosus]CAF4034436.1 unnamed protein product [Didymodactylos carnosus]
MILFSSTSVILSLTFLLIVLCHPRQCYSVSNMLVCNSCLCELLFSLSMLSMALFTYMNDQREQQIADHMCIFRGYLGYVTDALQNYSYALQAIYRYTYVVHHQKRLYQTYRLQFLFILIVWIFCFLSALVLMLSEQIKYNLDNQICQLPLRKTLFKLYIGSCVYCLPLIIIQFVYYKLIRYLRNISNNSGSTTAIGIIQAQREMQVLKRIIVLVSILITNGFPYLVFWFIAFGTDPPLYHFRISFLFVDVSLVPVMIAMFKFNNNVKDILLKSIANLMSRTTKSGPTASDQRTQQKTF